MLQVITLAGLTTRCDECRNTSDCLLTDESGDRTDASVHNRVRVFHDRERIHDAGAPLDAIYRVRSGWVKTTLTGPDGDELVTGFHGPGAWLGLDGLDIDRHRSDAVALDTVSVCVMPIARVRDRLCHSLCATRRMLAVMSERLAHGERLHRVIARDSAMQRLAGFLLDLCERREAAGLDPERIELPMSRGEIASYLALAVETVSRLLTRLQRAGIIEVHRHHLLVRDPAALGAEAGAEPPPVVESQAVELQATRRH